MHVSCCDAAAIHPAVMNVIKCSAKVARMGMSVGWITLMRMNPMDGFDEEDADDEDAEFGAGYENHVRLARPA